MHYRIAILGYALALVALTGCQLVLRLEEQQCEVDRDCREAFDARYTCASSGVCERAEPAANDTARDAGPDDAVDAGPSLPPQWSCLRGKLSTRRDLAETTEDAGTVFVEVTTRYYVDGQLPEDLVGKACNRNDFDCGVPLQENVLPDDEGFLRFELPYFSDAVVQLEAATQYPVLLYSNRPYAEDWRSSIPNLISEEVVQAGVALSDAMEVTPNSGIVIFQFYDCDDHAAPGVVIERLDGRDPRPFYIEDSAPDQDLPSSRVSTALTYDQSEVAAGGFFNVATGLVTYEARLEETGNLIAGITVRVLPETMTAVLLFPGDF